MARSLEELDRWTLASHWPRMLCPVCAVGTVGYERAEHQLDAESEDELELARQNLGPSGELSGTFTGTLLCDNSACRRQAAMAGNWVHTWDTDNLDEYGNVHLADMYRVQYVNPPLPLLLAPDRTPLKVKEEINGASMLLFLNPNAAGSRLRRAVEELMNAQHVNKTRVDRKTNKRVPATLHSRIEEFGRASPEIAEVLLAVKWIGNEGTHGRELTVADVVLCAHVLDAALTSLYDKKDAELRRVARRINRRKGLGRR